MTSSRHDPDLGALAALDDDLVSLPGSDGYAAATQPRNTTPAQRPAAVVSPRTTEQLAAAVAAAARAGAQIAVQATGHGAGRPLESETVLVDTRALDSIAIDADTRTATVGAGAQWGDVQAAAQRHGLLGCAGTAADVAVCGYTFAGGVGWLTRPHGLASAHLQAVDYVDGDGHPRRAAADAPEALDRDALWAFRGGAPVGVAATLTFELVEVPALAAGYLLWPAQALPSIASAWAAALPSLAPTVTSTLSLLSLPPDGPFPDELKGHPTVHLSCASPAGEADLAALREALVAVASPAVDTTGPCDAQRLATIHLDPPVPVPARGTGRWLSGGPPELVPRLLDAARIGEPGGLMMAELRHVAGAAPQVEGAFTAVPGPILLHGVGDAADGDSARDVEAALARLREAAAPVDLGRGDQSFEDGSADAGDAYGAEEAERLRTIAAALDPARRLRFERVP